MTIERIENLGPEELARRIRHGGAPFVLTGVVTGWRAFRLWSFEYLRNTIGDRSVKVGVSRGRIFHYDTEKHPRVQTRYMPFREAVRRITAHDNGPRDGHLYIMEQNKDKDRSLAEVYPELAHDYLVPTSIDRTKLIQTNLWIGESGNVTPLHFDAANNFLAQVIGRKRLTLFSPSQTHALYPNGSRRSLVNTSQVELHAPDYALHPKLKNAKPLECVLHPGEMLFLPPYWWHEVESLDAAVSVNFWWKAHLTQCLTPMGIQSVYYHHERGQLSDVSSVDISGFADLAGIAAHCLERGHRCAAVLFAKAELDRRCQLDSGSIERAVTAWRELLRRAEQGEDDKLDDQEVASLLRTF